MKKRIKIKKIIFSCITAICLGLGLVAPFINNSSDIVVNAMSTNSISCDYNGFTFNQIIHELDGTESFLSPSYVPVENSNVIKNSSNTPFRISDNTEFLTDLTDNYYCFFTTDGFGTSYGFYVSGITGFFNGFMFESDGSVYLANISVSNGQISVDDEFSISSYTSFYCTYSSTNDLTMSTFYYGNNISYIDFLNWFYNDLLLYNNGNYNLSKWGTGSVIIFNFANIFDYIDYFAIERALYSYTGAYGFTTSGNITFENQLVCREGILSNDYYLKSNPDSLFKFNNLSLDECSFIYSLISFNPYPSLPTIMVSNLPNYYRLNKLYRIERTFNLNPNLELSLIPTFESDFSIETLDFDITTGIITYNNSFPIYNKFTRIYYSPFSDLNNYFTFNLNENVDISCFSFNQLLYIGTSYTSLPKIVKGWYTFDIAPFDNISDKIDIDLDISFTADSIGYNNLRIIADTVLDTYVATICYRNLDNDRNVINEYVPYQFSRTPYDSVWTTYNARQLFFDQTIIDGNVYDILNSLGVFTFISNNPNNEQTMVDLFWGIAEVPIVTLRRAFDFEILGSNVSNLIMSMITVSLILFLIRRLL